MMTQTFSPPVFTAKIQGEDWKFHIKWDELKRPQKRNSCSTVSYLLLLSSSGRDREHKGIRLDAGLLLVCHLTPKQFHKGSEPLRTSEESFRACLCVFACKLACIAGHYNATGRALCCECFQQCNDAFPHCILVWWCMKDVVASSSSLSDSVLEISHSSSSSSSSSSSVTSSADWSSWKI